MATGCEDQISGHLRLENFSSVHYSVGLSVTSLVSSVPCFCLQCASPSLLRDLQDLLQVSPSPSDLLFPSKVLHTSLKCMNCKSMIPDLPLDYEFLEIKDGVPTHSLM